MIKEEAGEEAEEEAGKLTEFKPNLINAINDLVHDDNFPPTAQSKPTVVGETKQNTPTLTPVAIKFDPDGRAISTFKSVVVKKDGAAVSDGDKLELDTWNENLVNLDSKVAATRFATRAAEAAIMILP